MTSKINVFLQTRELTLARLLSILCLIGISILFISCSLSPFRLPLSSLIEPPKYQSTDSRVIGHLDWAIKVAATNEVIASGKNDVRLNEVWINANTSKDGRPSYSRNISLNKDFSFSMSSFPEQKRSEVSGFGLEANHTKVFTFCWEWFNVDNDRHASKLQETGELAIDLKQVNSQWEITRTEFLTDVSFRVDIHGSSVPEDNPRWRVIIRKGSYVNWPSLLSKKVLPNEPLP
jgi:hypothetical protein